MTQASQITTAAQLEKAGDIGRCELVRGELIMMSPAGGERGRIIGLLTIELGAVIRARDLGVVYGAETGFYIERNPDTVRAPDIAFVRKGRVAEADVKGFIPIAPDLAVEVLSPNDRAGDVIDKVHQWLDAGCQAVWVIDPRSRTVTTYGPGGAAQTLRGSDRLTGGDVVPGFEAVAADLFAW